MELSLERTERTYIKLIAGSFCALAILIALCWGGFRFYRHWQEGHLVGLAAASMSSGDLKNASLSARRALQLNPSNTEAMRIAAQISEKTGDRTALDWRRKIMESNPRSLDDALALVRCAIWLSDFGIAEKTLKGVEDFARQAPEFFAASARLAEVKKDAAGMERNWAKAVELAPNDNAYRLQLALSELGHDSAKRKGALALLEELRGDAGERAAATRALIIDGIEHRMDPPRTRRLANELADYSEALFSDRILYLEILRQAHDPVYEDYLARLKAEVPGKPSETAALLSWMTRNGMNAEAGEFSKSLPDDAASKWPVPLAMSEAQAQAKNWIELERLTREKDWSGYDFLRRAYVARALRGQEKQLAAEQELAAAEKEAAGNPQAISLLIQTMADWGWQKEATDLLWTLTKNPETRMPALQTLYTHYTKVADTSGLYRTLSKLAELNPKDNALQNNLAQVSLLLGADLDHARKVAADLAAQEPANSGYLSTYAFGLLTKGDVKGALRVMDGLKEEQLLEPSVATYYGLVLAAAGEKEKARTFLKRSADATLLPEEKALVSKATSSLD